MLGLLPLTYYTSPLVELVGERHKARLSKLGARY